MIHRYRQVLTGIALLALAGCTQGSSQIESTGQLPRPQVVVVEDFAVAPGEVQLDPGLSNTIREMVESNKGQPPGTQVYKVSRQVADALAEKLVADIRDLGLPAQRGQGLPPGVATGLVITGQFVSIDQGSRAERVTIGLGAGRSDVRVRAQVFDVSPAGRRLADEIEVDAKSGLQPGMAETMGAGALAGHLVTATLVSGGLQVADEAMGASVVADADRAAKGITKQLSSFFGEQRWTR